MNVGETFISSGLGYGLLAAFGILWVALGMWWGRKAKSLEGYALAGRNIGLALGAATAVATWITSNTTMLAPQFAIQLGVWGMLAYATASIGLFLFAPLAKRIQSLVPDGYTSGDFIRRRYGKGAWVMFLLISLFYALTWMISMAMAGGILLEALAGIPYTTGMSVILLVCVAYTLFGGLYAVVGTDFIQSLIILAGIVLVGVVVLNKVDFDVGYRAIQEDRPALLWVLMPAAIMAIFNNLLFGIGEIFHSNVWWSRAFAMRPGIGEKAYKIAGWLWLPIPIAAGFVALFAGGMDVNITRPDLVGPVVASTVLGHAGAVLVFIVVFCSLASSIDSLLAATSDLVAEDIFHKMLFPSATEPQRRRMATVSVVLIGLFTWAVCLPKIGTLATVLFFAGPLVGAAIWPILAGLYWNRATAKGAMLAMLAGSGVGLFAYFNFGWYTASLIGTAVSMVVVWFDCKFSRHEYDFARLASDGDSQKVKV